MFGLGQVGLKVRVSPEELAREAAQLDRERQATRARYEAARTASQRNQAERERQSRRARYEAARTASYREQAARRTRVGGDTSWLTARQAQRAQAAARSILMTKPAVRPLMRVSMRGIGNYVREW